MKSAIWKEPLTGRVRVYRLNLEGDRQADPSLHGGHDKAIYVYPSEHYAYWRARLGELAWGAFGENFTTEGLIEDKVRVGDQLLVGTAILEVTQPRTPCVKLAMRFQRPGIVREFMQSRRSGCYCSVLREGEVGAGDAITWGERAFGMASISELFER